MADLAERATNSQQPNGSFGPLKEYPNELGSQRDVSQGWWPEMVMLKTLKQYPSTSNNRRVIGLMTNYFWY